jgi:4-hydroxy-tetrahydrodipicolinate reductase
MMAGLPDYVPSLTEIHHIHKLDHPSGTAISLAEGVIAKDPAITGWTEEAVHAADTMKITAVREGEVPGTHSIAWDGPVDEITITHRAKGREGFALGAVMAAEWVAGGQSGWLTIDQFMESLLPCPQLLKAVK